MCVYVRLCLFMFVKNSTCSFSLSLAKTERYRILSGFFFRFVAFISISGTRWKKRRWTTPTSRVSTLYSRPSLNGKGLPWRCCVLSQGWAFLGDHHRSSHYYPHWNRTEIGFSETDVWLRSRLVCKFEKKQHVVEEAIEFAGKQCWNQLQINFCGGIFCVVGLA